MRTRRGAALVELLMAMTIMGITVVALVSGIGTSILVSDIHRKQATAQASVRTVAAMLESQVASGGWQECPASYTLGAVPSGYEASITSVQYWNGSAFTSSCAGSGVARVSLQVKSQDDRATERLQLTLRKPCGSSGAVCS